MSKVISCLFLSHDLRLVVLAGTLCMLSCFVAVMLLRRALQSTGAAQWTWLATGGAAGGFGIWATHFVAMLAYDAGTVFQYELVRTLSSLALAMAATTAATACATFLGQRAYLAAGLLFGLGISSMHFTGMAAIEFPGEIAFDRTLVICAIVIAVALAIPAFHLACGRGRRQTGLIIPSVVLTLGIVLMHFTAMGAVTVVPGPAEAFPASALSPTIMIVTIATVSLSLLAAGLTAALFAIRSERAVAAGEKSFRLLVQGVTDYAIYMLDREGRVANWNAGAQRAKGYLASEIVGKHVSEFYPHEDRVAGLPERGLETALRDGKFESEGWRLRKDGSRFWAHVVIDAIYDEQKGHIGFAKITRDRTEQMEAAARLKAASDNLALALANMANGICLYDTEERLVLHNKRLLEIFDIPEGTPLVGKSFRELCEYRARHGLETIAEVESFYAQNRALFTNRDGGELTRQLKNGTTVRTIHRPIGDGSWVSTIEDITERVQSESKINHLASHDSLTGLPNRAHFEERLDSVLARAETTQTRVAAICIDLDRFKDVNDSFGHAVGDELLKVLSTRMSAATNDGEFVARFGGDEFVGFKSFNEDAELGDFADRLMGALTTKAEIGSFDILPGASLGIAVYPADATDREKLLSNADMAMYRSKESPDERISFYEAGMDEAARERRSLARDVWTALSEEQFFLAYQVQKDARSGAITGYEVLLRWQHPERGLVPPATFIPVAEECGAISAIGDWVLEQACAEAALWPSKDKIAVNLSPLQLGNTALVDKVRTVLFKTGLPASRLELEVTESAIIGDKARALHILRQIKALGVTVAIDDFGTGYSSLETLRSFPFDKIKLDRSFTTDLENSRQSKAFVRAIVALGKSLEVSVLAEGVETEEQMRVLTAEGCDELQGFLLGRPAPYGEIEISEEPRRKKTA
ncbi:diguanylate cyclase [Rhizobium sp. Root708]|uniref:bifunctional diguanylate cyclase/phosphodiesterase n=1 Tax=Rhizobium sp. Root708 TaxID=1736592 RepID=UPI0006F96322|nr:EAL domain-containing protein [Rhizobium sp. Root708]KRB60030.1 diguanylate cyclase [Rhizobium sp. Root708]